MDAQLVASRPLAENIFPEFSHSPPGKPDRDSATPNQQTAEEAVNRRKIPNRSVCNISFMYQFHEAGTEPFLFSLIQTMLKGNVHLDIHTNQERMI